MSKLKLWEKVLGALGALIIGIIGGVILLRLDPPLREYFFPPKRKLTYYLLVQKMRDGKPYQEPFQSSGQEIFENGYEFKLSLLTPEERGYVYLFNEGYSADGQNYFDILYPTPLRNNGSAEVAANQHVETGINEFSGKPDTEKLWIIWTKELLPQLETAKAAAYAAEGRVTKPLEEYQLREFLQTQQGSKPEVVKELASKQTTIVGTGNVVVYLQHLEHR
jgi:hypothetical protein